VRVLSAQRAFERVFCGTQTRAAGDSGMIAQRNKKLEQMVRGRKFRELIFMFRLNVVRITMPPLVRARRISQFRESFLRHFSKANESR